MSTLTEANTATLRVARQLQISLMEYPLEVFWNRRRLGRVWTGLAGVYSVPAGIGVFQLGMRRAFWGGFAFSEPISLVAAAGETMALAVNADSHVLAVCAAHMNGLRSGYRNDKPFGLPRLTISYGSGPISQRVDWQFETIER